jgi:hypothetical protein
MRLEVAKAVTHPAYSCVTFLSHTPTKAELATLDARNFAPELFSIEGKEIYTWHPNGQARSALAAALGKLKLRGAVTTRNWNTVQKPSRCWAIRRRRDVTRRHATYGIGHSLRLCGAVPQGPVRRALGLRGRLNVRGP